MADTVGPFDSSPWAAAQWARFANVWCPSGVLGLPAAAATSGGLAFNATGRTVSAGTGRAWIRGFGFERTGTPPTHTASANTHASWSRRDRLVLRRDLATSTIVTAVKEGVAAATPTAPSLTQSDTGVWEIPLHSWLTPPNSGTALTGIVDERIWVDPDTGADIQIASLSPTLGSGLGGLGGVSAVVTRTGRLVELSHAYEGAAVTTNIHATTLPDWAWPPRRKRFSTPTSAGSRRMDVLTDGRVLLNVDGGTVDWQAIDAAWLL